MLTHSPHRSIAARRRTWVLVIALSLACTGLGSRALGVGGPFRIEFDSEWVQLNLSDGPFPVPLASDPANNLGDSTDGYGWVNSDVSLTLSSQRATPGQASLGEIVALQNPQVSGSGSTTGVELAVIDPDVLHGETFYVESFFDVYFDITFTDVDVRPGRDYLGQPHGSSIVLLDNGPTRASAAYTTVFDKDAPNYGLFVPADADPWMGFVGVEIPLGGDINVNGENDKIKFTLATFSAQNQSRTYTTLPDGTVVNEFDLAVLLQAGVVDESTDPPFSIGATLPSGLPDSDAFGGPTRADSELQNPVFPEPGTLSLLAIGGLAILRRRSR